MPTTAILCGVVRFRLICVGPTLTATWPSRWPHKRPRAEAAAGPCAPAPVIPLDGRPQRAQHRVHARHIVGPASQDAYGARRLVPFKRSGNSDAATQIHGVDVARQPWSEKLSSHLRPLGNCGYISAVRNAPAPKRVSWCGFHAIAWRSVADVKVAYQLTHLLPME